MLSRYEYEIYWGNLISEVCVLNFWCGALSFDDFANVLEKIWHFAKKSDKVSDFLECVRFFFEKLTKVTGKQRAVTDFWYETSDNHISLLSEKFWFHEDDLPGPQHDLRKNLTLRQKIWQNQKNLTFVSDFFLNLQICELGATEKNTSAKYYQNHRYLIFSKNSKTEARFILGDCFLGFKWNQPYVVCQNLSMLGLYEPEMQDHIAYYGWKLI